MIIPKATKKQKKQPAESQKPMHFMLLGSILILLFIFLQPKVASIILPQNSQTRLNTFLEIIEKEQKVDPQRYWEFREFYSPGSFDYSKNGLSIDTASLPISLFEDDSVILSFRSPRLVSYDILSTHSSLQDYTASLSAKDILLSTNNEILMSDESTTLILFLKDVEQMKKANGFLDYNGRDKNLVGNKKWLNVTMIKRGE